MDSRKVHLTCKPLGFPFNVKSFVFWHWLEEMSLLPCRVEFSPRKHRCRSTTYRLRDKYFYRLARASLGRSTERFILNVAGSGSLLLPHCTERPERWIQVGLSCSSMEVFARWWSEEQVAWCVVAPGAMISWKQLERCGCTDCSVFNYNLPEKHTPSCSLHRRYSWSWSYQKNSKSIYNFFIP